MAGARLGKEPRCKEGVSRGSCAPGQRDLVPLPHEPWAHLERASVLHAGSPAHTWPRAPPATAQESIRVHLETPKALLQAPGQKGRPLLVAIGRLHHPGTCFKVRPPPLACAEPPAFVWAGAGLQAARPPGPRFPHSPQPPKLLRSSIGPDANDRPGIRLELRSAPLPACPPAHSGAGELHHLLSGGGLAALLVRGQPRPQDGYPGGSGGAAPQAGDDMPPSRPPACFQWESLPAPVLRAGCRGRPADCCRASRRAWR